MLYDEAATMDAWADFVGGAPAKTPEKADVRAVIRNSWRRGLEGGADSGG